MKYGQIKNEYGFGESAYTRGYVSRKNYNPDNAHVYTAGGSRAGQLYILAPCYDSTRFCFRQYLKERETV